MLGIQIIYITEIYECLICDIILHAIHVANVRTGDITLQQAFCWIVCSRLNLNVLTVRCGSEKVQSYVFSILNSQYALFFNVSMERVGNCKQLLL